MKKRVLISAPYMLKETEIVKVKPMLQALNIDFDLADVHERLEEADLLKVIGQYDGIICGDDRMTSKVFDAAKKLQVVVKWGTGIDSLNKEYADKVGIKVVRTPNAFTEPVADTTLGYMLSFSRGLVTNDRILKSGGWSKPPGFCLFEKTVGLIGFGDIGRAVAKRLAGFGAKVLINDLKKPSEEELKQYQVQFASKEEIFTSCDIISLHCDLNSSSHQILNAQAFTQMPKKPLIINTARGPLIEEKALIKALQSGQVSGAGLDVFEEEPLPLDNPLRKMDQVLLASHNSNSSPTCWLRVHENSVKMLKEGLQL